MRDTRALDASAVLGQNALVQYHQHNYLGDFEVPTQIRSAAYPSFFWSFLICTVLYHICDRPAAKRI